MDSINRQQPEDNYEPLSGKAAAQKIQELAKQAQTCFFCTNAEGPGFATRPMNVFPVDERGHFYFLSADDSHKNAEIEKNPRVQLLLQGSDHSDFLSLEGTAKISRNKKKIDELWNPLLKTWFTEGKDDPRITVIEVVPKGGYYWDNKHGNAVAFAKIAIGALIGQTLDDSIEGELKP